MDRELIEQFIEVTGETEETAAQYLAAADGNVETAISLLFEGGNLADRNAAPQPEPSVRAPILPTQEVLVPNEPVQYLPRGSSAVFDRFRNFAVETQRQEEEMARRVGGSKRYQRNAKRLEDLFRPPIDISFSGSFSAARERAKGMNRWLLVDVHNPQEFACQILNRDVWPNKQIREILKDHFVLWQTSSTTSDGVRFVDFYNVSSYPYLAIIDPRTGECMRSFSNVTVDSMVSDLNDMLSTHASPESIASDPSLHENDNSEKHNSVQDSSNSNQTSCSKSSRKLETRDSKSFDAEASGSISSSTSSTSILSKRSRIDEFELKDKELKKKMQNEEKKPDLDLEVDENEPTLRLCLRLPSGSKETIVMSVNHTIEHFVRKMESMGFSSSDHRYSVSFPRIYIDTIPSKTRLADTVLYPSNTVFITKI